MVGRPDAGLDAERLDGEPAVEVGERRQIGSLHSAPTRQVIEATLRLLPTGPLCFETTAVILQRPQLDRQRLDLSEERRSRFVVEPSCEPGRVRALPISLR